MQEIRGRGTIRIRIPVPPRMGIRGNEPCSTGGQWRSAVVLNPFMLSG
jgi:hypothetical protein